MTTRKNKCCWVLQPAQKGKPAIYCDKPTGYTMPSDDDGRKVRQYNPWCAAHATKAAEQALDETED